LITLQPRQYTPVGKFWIGRLAPDWVFCQSVHTSRTLRQLGCRTALLPPAVDTQRFLPASRAEKETLRRQYKIPASATVVTHVGHLNGPRNLACFLSLQSEPGYQSVVVASTSTRQDRDLAATLRAAGVTVINTYVPNVEDIYRLSDAYVFAAEQYTAAIEVPLSVLEAMACNLPVVCTPFGGLQDFFPAGQGLFYWQPGTPLRSVVEEAVSGPCATRTLVEHHTWAAAANALVALLQGSEVPLPPQRGGTEYLSPPRRGAGGEVVQ
jgi:glycosyltransferase involved in cell wall biosynthesis